MDHDPFLSSNHGTINKHIDEEEEKALKRRKYIKWGVIAAVLIAVLLIVIFVGGGAVAQMAMDDAGITVLGMTVSNMTATTFITTITVEIDNRAFLSASLSHKMIDLKYKGKKFGRLPLPHTDLKAATTAQFTYSNLLTTVTDQAVFTQFGTDLLNEDSISMTMSGDVHAHGLGITFPIKLDKTVPMAAMGAFQTNVVLSNIVTNSTADSVTMVMIVNLLNPSVASFDNMEYLALDAFYDDNSGAGLVYVGTGRTTNASLPLVTGWNTVEIEATLVQTADNINQMRQLLSHYTNGLDIAVTLKGNAASCPVPLLQASLESLVINAAFNGLDSVVVQPHPPAQYTLDSYNVSLWQEVPAHVQGSYLQSRGQGKDEYLFSCVFGQFVFPNIVAIPDPVSCPDSLYHLYTDVILLLNNPLGLAVQLFDVDLSIYWTGDEAYGYGKTFFATGRTAVTETPYVTIGAFSTQLYKQRLCLTDDSQFTSAFLTEYLPAKNGVSDVTVLLGTEMSFPLDMAVNGTVHAKAGAYDATLNFEQEHIMVWSNMVMAEE